MSEDAPPPAPSRDWQKESDYRDLENLDRRGFAWEYLRRNPDYRDQHKHDASVLDLSHQGVRVIIPSAVSSLPISWGLRFRGVARYRSALRQDLLG